MKRAILSLCIVSFILAGAASAFAGTIDNSDQITLGASATSGKTSLTAIVFTGTGGGNFTVTFNTNANGAAVGTGGVFLGTSGFYTIMQNGATVQSTGVSCGAGCFDVSTKTGTGPLIFDLGSTAGGSDLLTGDLTLVDVSQSSKSGNINNQVLVNLMVTGGSLASDFPGDGGFVQLLINFSGNGMLATIASKQNIDAFIKSGTVNPQVPEPTSLVMLGIGLFGMAAVTRRKLSAKA